jgi:hypothetical protein
MFAAALKIGTEAGVFQVSDPVLVGRLIHYALDGALVHAILYEGDIDRERLIAAARELIRKALAP